MNTPNWQSGLITLTGAAILGVAEQALDAGLQNFTWELYLGDAIQIWIVSLVTWLGVSSDATKNLMKATPGFIGKPQSTPVAVQSGDVLPGRAADSQAPA